MYSSIRINGYCGLDSFRMDGLGRVNLLVGTNNSGKTSILECIADRWCRQAAAVDAADRFVLLAEGRAQSPDRRRRPRYR